MLASRTPTSILAAALLAAAASAQGVGPGSPTSTNHEFNQGGWWVGGPNDLVNGPGPISVSLDPNGPVWRKTLFPAPGGIIPPGQYFLHELITITPNAAAPRPMPWTDWHEQWVTPGVAWTSGGISLAGQTTNPLPGLMTMIDPTGNSIWFTFDPLFPALPGTPPLTIEIWKQFVVTGPNGIAGPLVLNEFPTPAPGGAALLALAGLASAVRRRR